jgi:hypothetical protein
MSWRIIRKLKPFEVFDIVTKGYCDHHLPEIKRQVKELRGEWCLENWNNDHKIDVLMMYLSESGFQLYTSKEEALSLEKLFKSWNLFYDVWLRWYGGNDTYIVGFQWDDEAFDCLYNEWLRNKKLEQIGI